MKCNKTAAFASIYSNSVSCIPPCMHGFRNSHILFLLSDEHPNAWRWSLVPAYSMSEVLKIAAIGLLTIKFWLTNCHYLTLKLVCSVLWMYLRLAVRSLWDHKLDRYCILISYFKYLSDDDKACALWSVTVQIVLCLSENACGNRILSREVCPQRSPRPNP